MSKYKLVIFDCDGVLVDSEMISAEIIAEVLQQVGIEMTTEESYKTFVGGSMAKTLAYVEERLGYLPEFDIEKHYRKLSFEAYNKKMKPVKGVEKILKSLTAEKCVASNGPKSKIDLNLSITGLQKYFDADKIYSAYDIQKWKPDPSLYLMSAEKNNVDPSECIVIEDSIHGLKAAEAAGMKSFGISYPLKPLPFGINGSEVYQDMNSIFHRLKKLDVVNDKTIFVQ